MKLYLVRHAEPMREEEDPERPLTEKGWADIRKVASFIAEGLGGEVGRIAHSGKTRALQTAEALAEFLRSHEGIEEVDGLNPLDDPSIWLGRLSKMQEDIMLVGHLPHLNDLSALLLCRNKLGKIINLPAAGALCLQKGAAGEWSINWMVIPEILV